MIRRIIIALILVVATSYLLAKELDGKSSSKEGAIYSAENWQALYMAYKRFGKKADGVVAEAFGDRIVTLLDEDWKSVSTLQSLCKKDKLFREFVLKFLRDDTVPYDSAERIKQHATTRCPVDTQKLCYDIKAEISIGLKGNE